MKCQDCQNEIPAEQGNRKISDIIDCQNCGAEYEVISIDPFKAEIIEEEK